MRYCSRDRLKTALHLVQGAGLDSLPTPDQNDRLDRVLDAVSAQVAGACGQDFSVTASAGTRAFAVPASTVCPTPALRSFTGVNVGATDVTADTALYTPPSTPTGGTPGMGLVYRPGGVLTAWTDLVAAFDPSARVVVLGVWGWDAVPETVAWVTEIGSVRAWLSGVGGYVTPGGLPALGTPPVPPVTLGDDLLLLLRQGGYMVN